MPVEGQESPWSRGLFVFAYDSARIADPPRTFEELLAYAQANPGRVTYPAPPDFTGSAFVRQVVQGLGEEEGFAYLRELQPLLWQQGRTHPGSEAELTQLFGDGQVDLAMSYDPSFVETGVRQGRMPETARPFVLDHGTLYNVSFVTIPANAANRAGALVVANLLLDPELQAIKAQRRSVIDLVKGGRSEQQLQGQDLEEVILEDLPEEANDYDHEALREEAGENRSPVQVRAHPGSVLAGAIGAALWTWGSCAGSMCDGPAPVGNCYCDTDCLRYDDCCADRRMICEGGSPPPPPSNPAPKNRSSTW